MTVIFDFVQPAVTCRRLFRRGHDLQLDHFGNAARTADVLIVFMQMPY